MRANLVQANALNIPLSDGSVQCVVTSPPYFGLRDYGVGGQIGLEPTLAEFIANMVAVFDEVWRVLRDDGTVWLNIGDSYEGGYKSGKINNESSTLGGGKETQAQAASVRGHFDSGLKPKDLMLVPHRLAIALQDRGWWVRSDIVWHKPNPMPESVIDRPTKAHEYIFLLTKNKKYYYDADAIREEANDKEIKYRRELRKDKKYDVGYDGYKNNFPSGGSQTGGRNKRSVWEEYEDEFAQFLNWKESQINEKKDVWSMTTRGYSGAHFATFPPELPETCIKAGSKEGDVVLDPFSGSGTTVAAAQKLGRIGIGVDLSWDYLQLAKERCGITAMNEWQTGKKAEANTEGLPMFK